MFAEQHLCDKLALKASIFAREKFVKVVKHEEFLDLPLDRLQWLTKHQELNIGCEDQVREWLKIDCIFVVWIDEYAC